MLTTINGVQLELETHPELFSPNAPDRGSLAMLSTVSINSGEKVLDLGCGYGLVALYAASLSQVDSVIGCDIDPRAVEVARKNAARNGLEQVTFLVSDGLNAVGDAEFSLILSNPPYHADFAVPKRFIEQGFAHLRVGGRLAMVVKRLTWYENKMRAVFGGVRVVEKDGYFILESQKRSASTAAKPRKQPSHKHLKRQAASATKKRRRAKKN